MSHTPVRATNLPAVGPYSPGMGFERLIFVSGQGGTDPATGQSRTVSSNRRNSV